MSTPDPIRNVLALSSGAKFFRCALQINPHHLSQTYRGQALGMGVRDKIIPGMRAHNETEPDLVAEESPFILRLRKEKRGE